MTPNAADIKAVLEPLPVLRGRTPQTDEREVSAAFAILASTGDTGVFAGSFDGQSAWERHRNGDELVHILDGRATVTIVVDGTPTELDMTAGMVTVVPQGCWHRFDAPDGVTVMTMTPQPTDHSTEETPPPDPVG